MGRYFRYFISFPQHALLHNHQKTYDEYFRPMFDKIHFTNVGQIHELNNSLLCVSAVCHLLFNSSLPRCWFHTPRPPRGHLVSFFCQTCEKYKKVSVFLVHEDTTQEAPVYVEGCKQRAKPCSLPESLGVFFFWEILHAKHLHRTPG